MALAAKVEKIASEKQCTPGQLALAWLLAQGDDVFPIPGTKRIKYLEENICSLNVKISPEEVKHLGGVFKNVSSLPCPITMPVCCCTSP
jgi:aryl-alcohol dehydrogenase-like predicted oxidoreductase